MSAQERALGKGPGVFLECNQEGIGKRGFKGGRGGGGGWSHVGNSNVAGNTYGSRVEKLILRDGA